MFWLLDLYLLLSCMDVPVRDGGCASHKIKRVVIAQLLSFNPNALFKFTSHNKFDRSIVALVRWQLLARRWSQLSVAEIDSGGLVKP